ncbi:aminoglycoside 3'-phosphotransferase [Gryllotalpicola ginsengisoli]|uniref:aminoglycoside 3'-phosphotransferase n=1 Tax=Gryllotalpicola ginsengisoli TaxID=444608 RepID=UPI0003B3C707|nr:aminoglycoside 3'-phosphotransferase [Gryllotalpicola ginsengisoli]
MTSKALAGPPPAEPAVPQAVLAFAAGAPLRAVWQNEAGGLTYRVDAPEGARFVKWDPRGSSESLRDERERLEWLAGRFPAPRVIAAGVDETGEWLATEGLDALSAVVPPWSQRPELAVRAIAQGLRMLHDTLDPAECPFSWSAEQRVAAAARRGNPVPAELRRAPGIDRLVVCHGDPCSPNTLVARSGEFAGIVDVGRLGTADRWADLAVASASLEWNYGVGWDGLFFETYGVAPDAERIAYYRALWDAT